MREMNEDPAHVIDWFDDFGGPNEYAFLSNFYPCNVRVGDQVFPTSEHAFAYAKVDPWDQGLEGWRHLIAEAAGPNQAKSLGRECPLRDDWETVKFGVMQSIVEAKFRQNPGLAERLIATGDAYLQEGTFWGDECWGVDASMDVEAWYERPGSNWLGTILMEVRARLLAERREGLS